MTYILIALGALSLIAFLIFRDKRSSSLAVSLKSLTSLLFIATAVTAIASRDQILTSDALIPDMLVLLGLVAGLIGDILLDLKIFFKAREESNPDFKKDKDIMMYAGMGAFGVGHILYVISLGVRFGNWSNLLWSALISALLAVLIIIGSKMVLRMDYGKFMIPCLIYCFLLSMFVVVSIFNIAELGSSAATVLLLIGSLMFIISDLILSTTYFSKEEDYQKEGFMNPESRFMIITNHVTYYIAQFLIALSLLFL